MDKNTFQTMPPFPSFGILHHEEYLSDTCRILRLEQVTQEDFNYYVQALDCQGFALTAQYHLGPAQICVFKKVYDAVFLSFFPDTAQLRVVWEENSRYLHYMDHSGKADLSSKNGDTSEACQPQLTQIDLEDFGLSYLLRLPDGRFIIIDGGWDFEADADKLMTELNRQSPFPKPRIAAWIFTHPHDDHYPCFCVFCDKYACEVTIETFLYAFPPLTQEVLQKFPGFKAEQDAARLARFESCVQQVGAPVIHPHTGQVFDFGNAILEILSSPDDICSYPTDVNTLSLITRCTIGGQSILFCADGLLEEVRFSERYGTYLKSDILQITHHGFNGGSETCYKLIDPTVCLIPCNEQTFLRYMGYYNSYNRALIYDMNVQDYLIGGQPQVHLYPQKTHNSNIVLSLPYEPRPNGRQIMLERVHEIQKEMGAKSWFFADMTWETCQFSILNPVYPAATVYATLYFEERTDIVRNIKLTVPGYSVKKIDFQKSSDIDGNAFLYNPNSLSKKGIPVGKTFSVHLHSDTPIVIESAKAPIYTY